MDTSWEGSEDDRKGVSLETRYVRRISSGRNIGREKCMKWIPKEMKAREKVKGY
jgi:hypothetical protein